ncbi:PCRF domain-containing protein, partial [Candidatus Falkowbacteria bacterium]|nr:PCRF domain-containing protein [Candidatus Falkowbacteria bacterium]
MSKPDFWSNRAEAIKISKDLEALATEVNKWEDFKKEITDLEQLVAVAIKEKDNSISDDANQQYEELDKKFSELEFAVL